MAIINIDEDLSEKNDLSRSHPEILKELVLKTEEWSKTHIQPKWFHDEKTGIEWRQDSMPHFDKTFSLIP